MTWKAAAELPLLPGENLEVLIFVDQSIIEVFVNDRVAITARTYPKRDDVVGATWHWDGDGHGRVEFKDRFKTECSRRKLDPKKDIEVVYWEGLRCA